MSVPRGMSAHPLSIVSQAGVGARMTDSPRVTEGCSGIEGAIGGLASAAQHAVYSVPPRSHPISQAILYGDLNSGAVIMNLGSQGGVPNLFGLPAPVYAGTVPSGAPNTARKGCSTCQKRSYSQGRQEWDRICSSRSTVGQL